MNLFLIASAILIALSIAITRKRQEKMSRKDSREFWERERLANSVRRKSLDSLALIQVPLEELPLQVMAEDSRVSEYHSLLRQLATQPIANFTGYTNTDLKLEYGAANLPLLSEYDQNYTLLARTLQQWADVLLENGYADDARVIMEYALQTNSDVSRTYYRLAELYAASGETARLQSLAVQAQSLRSPHKEHIVRTLREKYSPEASDAHSSTRE